MTNFEYITSNTDIFIQWSLRYSKYFCVICYDRNTGDCCDISCNQDLIHWLHQEYNKEEFDKIINSCNHK